MLVSAADAITDYSPEMREAVGTKRLIALSPSDAEIAEFTARGCVQIHELKDALALECPLAKLGGLRVIEDEVLHILDLNADKQIAANKVWNLSAAGMEVNGTTIKVAVLDTGVDYNHSELNDSISGGRCFVSGCSDFKDDNGHGTHVAGIITADGVGGELIAEGFLSRGVAPGASIYAGKVCDKNGNCFSSDIAAGIDWAILQGADVISISLGGGNYFTENCDSTFLASKVNEAVGKNVTVVVSAGNENSGVSSPACASGAIAVGAVDSADVRASFSNFGPALDIMAPGVRIYSTMPTYRVTLNRQGYSMIYSNLSGTSMAAPMVSGVVALMLQKRPEWKGNVSAIKQALYGTAKDLGSAGFDNLTGWGRVDAFNAALFNTCGISSSASGLNFGDVENGQTSAELQVNVTNAGTIAANYTISGTNWASGSGTMDVNATRFSLASSNYSAKAPLQLSDSSFIQNLAGGAAANAFFQLQPSGGLEGSAYSQNMTITVSC